MVKQPDSTPRQPLPYAYRLRQVTSAPPASTGKKAWLFSTGEHRFASFAPQKSGQHNAFPQMLGVW